MIYEISHELSAELRARGVPYPVIYRESRTRTIGSVPDTRIVIERDRRGGDQAGNPISQFKNPRRVASRRIGVLIRVFAQSTIDGAREPDHEDLADEIIDHVEMALRVVLVKRKTFHAIAQSKLLDGEEMAALGIEQWPGVVYELRVLIDRNVIDRNFIGEAREQTTLTAINSTTKVRLGVGPPETACGGS